MNYPLLGAALIVTGCGGFGFSMAAEHLTMERELRQLLKILCFMENQLEYRLTPLPELCRQAGKESGGRLGRVFADLARELDWQSAPDAAGCMAAALGKSRDLPGRLRMRLLSLGQTLGRFDLPGQLQGLEQEKENCRLQLEALRADRGTRLRSYGTLGLCAGAALAILLL